MRVLIIDNYDSFTYNLYQLVGGILADMGEEPRVDVIRNDEITADGVADRKYDRIIVSPGPGSPDNEAYFGVCAGVIRTLGKSVPVLGVCLGMQGMAYVFGGRVERASLPMHGKTSRISHSGTGLFRGLPQGIEVMRYHSLAVPAGSLPTEVTVTATTDDGTVMGLQHRRYPITGVQFHPESFASEVGEGLLRNFLEGEPTNIRQLTRA